MYNTQVYAFIGKVTHYEFKFGSEFAWRPQKASVCKTKIQKSTVMWSSNNDNLYGSRATTTGKLQVYLVYCTFTLLSASEPKY